VDWAVTSSMSVKRGEKCGRGSSADVLGVVPLGCGRAAGVDFESESGAAGLGVGERGGAGGATLGDVEAAAGEVSAAGGSLPGGGSVGIEASADMAWGGLLKMDDIYMEVLGGESLGRWYIYYAIGAS
jgi:hypothetical protein